MEIKLTSQESEDIFHTALCNGLEYTLSGYGLAIDYSDEEYGNAVDKLRKENPGSFPAYEDTLLEMLRMGYKLTIIDEEGGDDEAFDITLKDVHERVPKTPIRHLMDMINEEDDADTADVVIQQVFFNDIMFG